MIWATRGRTWGFRFLRDGGLADPLPTYQRYFPVTAGDPAPVRHIDGVAALRLEDPEGRRDRSGRAIVHEFIVDGDLADRIVSEDDTIEIVWPLVRDTYAAVWNLPEPPEPPAS